jgi:hypothetical protein
MTPGSVAPKNCLKDCPEIKFTLKRADELVRVGDRIPVFQEANLIEDAFITLETRCFNVLAEDSRREMQVMR